MVMVFRYGSRPRSDCYRRSVVATGALGVAGFGEFGVLHGALRLRDLHLVESALRLRFGADLLPLPRHPRHLPSVSRPATRVAAQTWTTHRLAGRVDRPRRSRS